MEFISEQYNDFGRRILGEVFSRMTNPETVEFAVAESNKFVQDAKARISIIDLYCNL